MLKHKAFKFRIYPNNEQKILISKTIGCSRFVFNYLLDAWLDLYETTGSGLSYNKCSAILTELKKQDATIWMNEVDSIALQTSARHLADGFDRFFKKQNDKPRFKSKKNPVQSYTTKFVNNNIRIEDSRLKLPKLGWVSIKESRKLEGRIINATLSRKPSGKYFVSILCETDIEELPKTGSSVGVDVGIKDFAVFSDGMTSPNMKYYQKSQKKLKKEQQILARRQRLALEKGIKLSEAKNYQKQRIIVARIHENIENQRLDFLHKLSTKIVKNHDIIGMESLDIVQMLQNKQLSKQIGDVSWAKFKDQIRYKADWYGKTLVEVDQSFPSSQLCHVCGHKNPQVKELSVRDWTCPTCNTHHDRDLNASINIKKEALRITASRTAGTAEIA
ncbi:IS200/IS605 family element transposase accessory protein TnpB [Proteiniclasticum sp. SCR006]|uniref:IS200/IS605 family element transposase accessory protein TnpB n=1 Tax=Proteiniclasticum aestuarii TaxID=2817862 RepID=A0A939HEN4_9CLOT|nr:IS200/IS605 family element RNA-guided endonuclease TnpB [Proteiniclasticum aestuarii]MBO1265913.1 IS200/IS605 family element transposase accessory protein TnpB [Proteiniclasticum aestuarii]